MAHCGTLRLRYFLTYFRFSEELEEEAQGEVDKILAEILGDQLATAPSAIKDSLPAEREAIPGTSAESEDMTEMQARLQALRN